MPCYSRLWAQIGKNNQRGWNVRNQKHVFGYLTLRPNNNSRGMNVPRLTESTCACVGSNGACDQPTAIAINANQVGNCGDWDQPPRFQNSCPLTWRHDRAVIRVQPRAKRTGNNPGICEYEHIKKHPYEYNKQPHCVISFINNELMRFLHHKFNFLSG